MKIEPLVTEKSLIRAKLGKYSFVVPSIASSGQVRQAVEEIFSAKVKKVWTLKQAAENYRSRNRKHLIKPGRKVAIVSLKTGKIDIFDSIGASGEKDNKEVKEAKSPKDEPRATLKLGGKKDERKA